jgi:ferrochelatase
VVWDLDNELRIQAEEAGVAFARATTPNADPRFARLAVDLVDELRLGAEPVRLAGPDPVAGCGYVVDGRPCASSPCCVIAGAPHRNG